jgi:hypothetical protein
MGCTPWKTLNLLRSDDSQPYPNLMGLEWVVDNQEIINLKKRETIFEVGDLNVTAPLDPSKGKRYT